MNRLLEKFSSAEKINEVSQIKSLARIISREDISQSREVVSFSETILWKQKSYDESTSRRVSEKHLEVIRKIRKSYKSGKIFFSTPVPEIIDVELSLLITAGVRNLLSTTSEEGHIGLNVKFKDGLVMFHRVYPIDVQKNLGTNTVRASIGGRKVILQGAPLTGNTLKLSKSLEV